MKLTPHDTKTPLWTKLVLHYEPILAKNRARAENPLLPEAERIDLLWQIKFIKDFLALAQPDEKKATSAG